MGPPRGLHGVGLPASPTPRPVSRKSRVQRHRGKVPPATTVMGPRSSDHSLWTSPGHCSLDSELALCPGITPEAGAKPADVLAPRALWASHRTHRGWRGLLAEPPRACLTCWCFCPGDKECFSAYTFCSQLITDTWPPLVPGQVLNSSWSSRFASAKGQAGRIRQPEDSQLMDR